MKKRLLITTCVVLAFVIALAGIYGKFFYKNPAWYAVHVNNNQVYFGHIDFEKRGTVVLSDAHYLAQVEQSEPLATSKNFTMAQAGTPAFELTRRGDDSVLASDHTIFINRDAVLFWEKLDPGADIIKLIIEYDAKH